MGHEAARQDVVEGETPRIERPSGIYAGKWRRREGRTPEYALVAETFSTEGRVDLLDKPRHVWIAGLKEIKPQRVAPSLDDWKPLLKPVQPVWIEDNGVLFNPVERPLRARRAAQARDRGVDPPVRHTGEILRKPRCDQALGNMAQ